MNLNDWRKSGERLAMAGEVLGNAAMIEMLFILESAEHPARSGAVVGDGFGATFALGEIRGYERCLRSLRLFAQPLPPPPEEVPITWNVEHEE